MATLSAPLWRFTVDDFERMGETGILREDDRVELIDGQIVEMSPIGIRHGSAVLRSNRILGRLLGERAFVGVQGPVRVGKRSQVQPYITLLRPRDDFYAVAHPSVEDVFLLIEVADSSLLLDRNQKVPLYAREGVAEVWLVNLVNNTVEAFRHPEHGVYTDQLVFERGSELSPLAFPDLRVRVDDLIGG